MKASMKKPQDLYSFLCPKRTPAAVCLNDSKLNSSLDDFEDPKVGAKNIPNCKAQRSNRLNKKCDEPNVVDERSEKQANCDEEQHSNASACSHSNQVCSMSYEDFLCSQDGAVNEIQNDDDDNDDTKCVASNVTMCEQQDEDKTVEKRLDDEKTDDGQLGNQQSLNSAVSSEIGSQDKLSKKSISSKRKLRKKSTKEDAVKSTVGKEDETCSVDEVNGEDVVIEKPVGGIRNYFTTAVSKPVVDTSCEFIAMTVNADVHASPKGSPSPVFSIFKRGQSKTGVENSPSPPAVGKNCVGKRRTKHRSNVVVENHRLDLSISEEQKEQEMEKEKVVSNKGREAMKTIVCKSKSMSQRKQKLDDENIKLNETPSPDCIVVPSETTPPNCCLTSFEESQPVVHTSKKTTQAKLNFGLVANKEESKTTCEKLNLGSDQQTDDFVLTQRKRLKTSKNDDRVPMKRSNLLQKKRLRAMYRSVIIQKANVFKKTPIKMKLLRIAAETIKTDQSEEFTKTKRCVKDKAQRNIDKAKSKKVAKAILTSEVESEGCDLRRSVRRSSMAAKSAILLCYEEPTPSSWPEKQCAKTPKRQSSRLASDRNHSNSDDTSVVIVDEEEGKLVKTPCKKTPCKSTKLASIFQPKPRPATVDPETLQRRREFLLSSAPTAMKTELRTRDQQAGRCAPWPSAHVLQTTTTESMCVQATKLVLQKSACPLQWRRLIKVWPLGSFVDICSRSQTNKHCIVKKAFSHEMVNRLLAEISTENTNFPVSEIYKELIDRKRSCSNEVESCQEEHITADKSTRKRKRAVSLSLRGKKVRCSDGDKPAPVSGTLGTEEEGQEEEAAVVIVDDGDNSSNSVHEADLQWTEKYAPLRSSGIVGHLGALHRLRSWLRQWKRLTERQVAKENRKERKKLETSMDDFTADDGDDSEDSDEDCHLSNTMLLTGPHGIGKTAMVYAMAAELGYKVFEVNASSQRSGKRVLCELQEATQSQRVCSKNAPAHSAGPGIAGLFAGKNTHSASSKEKALKTDKRGASSADSLQKTSGLDLSSTSLILFEEVDIVFEEDKGLWAAIETFIETTKRPIILTTNDVNFRSRFGCPLDENRVRVPSLTDIASYLQTVCLVENIRSDFHDVLSLVKFMHGDIRRCMLAMQFWVESGGSLSPAEKPVKPNCILAAKRTEVTPNEDDSRFTAIRTKFEDDSSCEAAFLSITKKEEATRKTCRMVGDNIKIRCTVPVHDNCLASLTEASSYRCSNILQELCKLENSPTMVSLISHYRTLGVDFLYSNMHRILSLGSFEPIRRGVTTDTISESSLQNCIDENSEDSTCTPSREKCTKPVVKESIKSIEALARLQDDLSIADFLYNPQRSQKSVNNGDTLLSYDHIQPGLGDHVTNDHECDWSEYNGLDDVAATIELLSFRRAREALDAVRCHEHGEGHQMGRGSPGKLRMTRDKSEQIRGRHMVQRAVRNVSESIKSVGLNQNDLIDYMSSVRTICQSEKSRQEMKVKRRFFHYFDHIQLRLKSSVLDQLCTPISPSMHH